MHHAKVQVVRYFWNISDFLVFFVYLFACFFFCKVGEGQRGKGKWERTIHMEFKNLEMDSFKLTVPIQPLEGPGTHFPVSVLES